MIYEFDYRSVERGRMFCFLTMLVVFIFLAGFRYRLGQDTVMYVKEYANLHPINLLSSDDFKSTRFAPGFLILTSFFRVFGPDFIVFQVVHSIFVNAVIFWFLYKNSRHLFFSILLFFFYLYFLLLFQQMRESIAVSIFLLAWPAFRDGKWLIWYIASLLAFSFHISAFVMFILPLLYLPGIRQLFVFGIRTWFICAAIMVIAFAIQAVFFKYIELIAFTETMIERVQTYDKNVLGGSLLNINGIVGKFIQYLLYPLVALFFVNKENKNKKNDDEAFRKEQMMTLMSVYIGIFSIFVAIVARYNNYFFIFAILLLSDWIFTKLPIFGKKLRVQFVYWFIFFLPMFGFQFYNTYYSTINKSGTIRGYMVYYPYSSYFDQTIDKKREEAIRYIIRKIK